jgi:hypothetical protein
MGESEEGRERRSPLPPRSPASRCNPASSGATGSGGKTNVETSHTRRKRSSRSTMTAVLAIAGGASAVRIPDHEASSWVDDFPRPVSAADNLRSLAAPPRARFVLPVARAAAVSISWTQPECPRTCPARLQTFCQSFQIEPVSPGLQCIKMAPSVVTVNSPAKDHGAAAHGNFYSPDARRF